MSSSQTPTLSIIIPALNEAHFIGVTLDAVSRLSGRVELIVVDGGSDDETREISSARGAKVITSERGRGMQMHRGACASQGGVLWFLHADTIVAVDALECMVEALGDPQVVGGNFNVSFDGPGRTARFMTWLYPELRRLGLCYGDSAIFVRREAYEQVGGFKSFPIFEDLDLMKRLCKRGRVVHLPAVVATSSRRFEGRSFALTFALWAGLQLLYWLGVDPPTLGRLYAPVRQSGKLHPFAAARRKNGSKRRVTN
jgi:rSAM/selenodomain-associated transferase 2